MNRLKADFHTHSCDDARDHLDYSAEMLIDSAAATGMQVLSITCHEVFAYADYWAEYAADRGILLIPGVELMIENKHVLVLNPAPEHLDARTFADLRRIGKRDALFIAPHPYFPVGASLLGALAPNIDLFDAIEYTAFYRPWLNLNRLAERAAKRWGLPLVGNTDTHSLPYVPSTFTWVESEPAAAGVLDAIRAGRVSVETRPRPWREIFRIVGLSLQESAYDLGIRKAPAL